MTAEINTPLDHIERSLKFQKGEQVNSELPSMLLDTIQTIVEAKGWQAVERQDVDSQSATNPANGFLRSASPPADERWWIFAGHVFHTDAVANHTLRIDFEDIGEGLTVSLVNAVSVPASTVVALPRPVLIRQNQNLRATSVDLLGVGNDLRIQMFFVRLEKGEYVPGASPMG